MPSCVPLGPGQPLSDLASFLNFAVSLNRLGSNRRNEDSNLFDVLPISQHQFQRIDTPLFLSLSSFVLMASLLLLLFVCVPLLLLFASIPSSPRHF